VKLTIPMFDDLELRISDRSNGGEGFPTARLQKGLVLFRKGEDLTEEGVGFGVPILKRDAETIFPGGMELSGRRDGAIWRVTAVYEMNLVERLAGPRGASVRPRSLYAAKNALAALHRRLPVLRRPLTATSAALRRLFGWQTTFEQAAFRAAVGVRFIVDGERGTIDVAVDLTGLPTSGVSEVIVMNELGARHFDRYRDAGGADLRGAAIGTWDQVTTADAAFVSDASQVAFSLAQVDGARLSRGRELIGARVAWSGFGYSLPPTLREFKYTLRIEQTA
jgi:hypothetical protein